MGSKVVAFLVLSLNLLFFTMVSSQVSPPPPNTDVVDCLVRMNVPPISNTPLPDVPVGCCGVFESIGHEPLNTLCSVINGLAANGTIVGLINPAATYDKIVTTCGLSNGTGGYECTSGSH